MIFLQLAQILMDARFSSAHSNHQIILSPAYRTFGCQNIKQIRSKKKRAWVEGSAVERKEYLKKKISQVRGGYSIGKLIMEVILVTGKPEYKSLIHATKTIQSPAVDIVAIIDTEVFLNHHYDISFYCFRDNFPFQMHLPIKVAKQLLDRNEGEVTLQINNSIKIAINSENQLMEIFPNIQQAIQEPVYDSASNMSKICFSFQFYEIQIKFIILNEMEPKEQKLRDAIHGRRTTSKTIMTSSYISGYTARGQESGRVNKAIVFINDDNYEQFLSWSEGQNDSLNCEMNSLLSQEYLSLKQEVDNEKSSFRNKIKMVEALLGENINVQKLLIEDKEENAEFKRLKETFETIKNIDKVIIDQEKRIETFSKQLKEKRALKQQVLYEKAKVYTKMCQDLKQTQKNIEQLRYKLSCIESKRNDYQAKRSFEPTVAVNKVLEKYTANIKKYSSIKMNELRDSSTSEADSVVLSKLWQKNTVGQVGLANNSSMSALQKNKSMWCSPCNPNQQKRKQVKYKRLSTIHTANGQPGAIPLQANQVMQALPINTLAISSQPLGIKCQISHSAHMSNQSLKENYRNVMMERSMAPMSKDQNMQVSDHQGYVKRNADLQKEIDCLEECLMQMADYYGRNISLISQIKKRNQSDKENKSQPDTSIQNYLGQFRMLKGLLDKNKPALTKQQSILNCEITDPQPNKDLTQMLATVPSQALIPSGIKRQPSLGRALRGQLEVKKQKDECQTNKVSSTNISGANLQESDKVQIIPKSSNKMRKCSLMKEDYIEGLL